MRASSDGAPQETDVLVVRRSVTFLPTDRGGRGSAPGLRGARYRPLVSVEREPGEAPAVAGGAGTGVKQLEAAFLEGPANFALGEQVLAVVALWSAREAACAAIRPGARFGVVEGRRVVGHGTVGRRLDRERP